MYLYHTFCIRFASGGSVRLPCPIRPRRVPAALSARSHFLFIFSPRDITMARAPPAVSPRRPIFRWPTFRLGSGACFVPAAPRTLLQLLRETTRRRIHSPTTQNNALTCTYTAREVRSFANVHTRMGGGLHSAPQGRKEPHPPPTPLSSLVHTTHEAESAQPRSQFCTDYNLENTGVEGNKFLHNCCEGSIFSHTYYNAVRKRHFK